MSEVCSPDRFYSDNIMVNLFERVICTSAKLMTKEEIKNSPLDGESEMVEIPIRDFIHSGARYLSTLEKIRAISDKNERDDMKRALLPAASISATFTTRDGNIQLEKRIKNYTGIISLDIDNVPNVEDEKKRVAQLPWVWYCGLSSSGRGFFALVPTDNRDYRKHKLYFAALSAEMEKMGLKADQRCSDVTRLRFVTFDGNGIFNEGCEFYHLPEGFTVEEPVKRKKFVPLQPTEDTDTKINDYIREWLSVGAVIDDYSDWLPLCMALSTLGERGWDILDLISQSSSHYNEKQNRKVFDYGLRKNRQITIATFFYMCHKYGVRPPRFTSPEYDISDIPEVKIPYREIFGDEVAPEPTATPIEDDIDDYDDDGYVPTPPFPYEVFPDEVRKIVEQTHEHMNFPIDFIGSALIVASAGAVSNSLKVYLPGDWVEKPIVYMAIVGEPGTNKSAPLDFAIKPLEERDDEEMEIYNKKYDVFELEQKKALAGKGIMPNPPDYHQLILNDYTMEALMAQHAANPRGMLVVQDELLNFTRNMGRYSNGNDEMIWTKLFSGGSIQTTRKNKRQTKLRDACVSICGTIQPASLKEFSRGKTENGFVDRWLFAYPNTPASPRFKYGKPMPEIKESWKSIVNRMLDMEYSDKNTPKMMSDEAMKLYGDWFNKLAERKDLEGTIYRMTATKMEKYIVRLAIVLDAMRYGCDGKPIIELSGWAMEGALKLVEYYLICGLKARRDFNYDPTMAMSVLQKKIYKRLPISFTTGEGVEIAVGAGMCERSFKKWLHSSVFLYTARGNYQRRYK